MGRESADRIELRPTEAEQRVLLDLVYPEADAPWVENVTDAYYQAARDMIRHVANGGTPPEIWRGAGDTSGVDREAFAAQLRALADAVETDDGE